VSGHIWSILFILTLKRRCQERLPFLSAVQTAQVRTIALQQPQMLFEQNWQNWQNWQVTKSSKVQVLQTLPTSMIRLEILLISSSLEAQVQLEMF